MGHKVAARVLEGVPGALEQQALLRVHQLRLGRRCAEERSVEAVDVVQEEAAPDEARVFADVRTREGRLPFGGRDVGQALDAVLQVVPKRVQRRRSGAAHCHADDGNVPLNVRPFGHVFGHAEDGWPGRPGQGRRS